MSDCRSYCISLWRKLAFSFWKIKIHHLTYYSTYCTFVNDEKASLQCFFCKFVWERNKKEISKNDEKGLQNRTKSVRILFVADADVAQQVERILGKDEVTGSNPVISSN